MKPRTVVWERLFLDAESPLRVVLDPAGRGGIFSFLPDLKFFPPSGRSELGGEVMRVNLEPLGDLAPEGAEELARLVGRSLALWSWFGVSDLHWENLALGRATDGRIVFTPLDVESLFDDFSLPTHTKLLPDADPEVAEVCRHACGVRRVLPFLGKPIDAQNLVGMTGEYLETLALLDQHGDKIGEVVSAVPHLDEVPIRVCLRGTDVYMGVLSESASPQTVWPPLLEAEEEQLARGDVPYFFRLYGRPGLHYYGDASLQTTKTLPTEGDVPQLDPLLSLSGGLRSPSRDSLRVEGLFTVLGAFDAPSIRGSYRDGDLRVDFGDEFLTVETVDEELEVARDLSEFVGSVYLPCRCGEVGSVLVPSTTVCEG